MLYEINKCQFCDNKYKDAHEQYGFIGIAGDYYICNTCEAYIFEDEYSRLSKKADKKFGEDDNTDEKNLWLSDKIKIIIQKRKEESDSDSDSDNDEQEPEPEPEPELEPEPTTTSFVCEFRPVVKNPEILEGLKIGSRRSR